MMRAGCWLIAQRDQSPSILRPSIFSPSSHSVLSPAAVIVTAVIDFQKKGCASQADWPSHRGAPASRRQDVVKTELWSYLRKPISSLGIFWKSFSPIRYPHLLSTSEKVCRLSLQDNLNHKVGFLLGPEFTEEDAWAPFTIVPSWG